MKIKFLETIYKFIPINPDDLLYAFDYPKFTLKSSKNYKIVPLFGKSTTDLPEAQTAQDYDVWAFQWGYGVTDPEISVLLNPSKNNYKSIVWPIQVPAPDGIIGTNGYRHPQNTSYTTNTTSNQWNTFKTRLSLTPKGRRVIDTDQYWYNEVYPWTAQFWSYYKDNTTDGITYNNERFLSLWKDNMVQDASTSFNAFLSKAHTEGVSFDYIVTDFESWDTGNIDGVFSYTAATAGSGEAFGFQKGITTDPRNISAWLADTRFTDYVFPKTQKTFTDLFYEKYLDYANADPLITNKPDKYNSIGWGANIYTYIDDGLTAGNFLRGPSDGFLDQWQIDTLAENISFYIPSNVYSQSTKILYKIPRDNITSGVFYLPFNTDEAGEINTAEFVGKAGQKGFAVKLMGQTLDNVNKFIITQTDAGIALKTNGHVLAWGSNLGFGGTDANNNPYGITATNIKGLPVQIQGITLAAKDIAATNDRVCAIKNDDLVVCWGYPEANDDVPAGLTASKIVGGESHYLALQGNNLVVAWGDNTSGQCNVPSGLTAVYISAGNNHSCVAQQNGNIICWGDNTWGQTTVPAGLTANQVVCGLDNVKALKNNGTVVCWGRNNSTIIGTNQYNQGITLPAILTGQAVKKAGITLNNIGSLNNLYFTNTANHIAIKQLRYNPVNSLQALSLYTGVTFSDSRGLRGTGRYWTPYGCEGSGYTCGCGPDGSRDIRKQSFSEVTGYTYSMYSIHSVVAPAWYNTVKELSFNNYYKIIYHDSLTNAQYPSYNNVKVLFYDSNPSSAEELQFEQDSNLRKNTNPSIPWAGTSYTYYFQNRLNLIFTASTSDFFTNDAVEEQGSYRQAWALRSGYIRNPQTDYEKYNFSGYLDINLGNTCSNVELVRYPLTNVHKDGGDPKLNYYKFLEEDRHKLFVYFMKTLRHGMRSDTNMWENHSPWIWNFNSGWSLYPGTISFPSSLTKINVAYWYELNFHLLLHGTRIFQMFQSLPTEVQRTLDIWRNISYNSQARPCSNTSADVNKKVDRILLQDAFEKYVISGGKSLKSNNYIWRITVPVTLFNEDGYVTLTRVGNNSDFPSTVTLDRNAATAENRIGFWCRSLTAEMPVYTIS